MSASFPPRAEQNVFRCARSKPTLRAGNPSYAISSPLLVPRRCRWSSWLRPRRRRTADAGNPCAWVTPTRAARIGCARRSPKGTKPPPPLRHWAGVKAGVNRRELEVPGGRDSRRCKSRSSRSLPPHRLSPPRPLNQTSGFAASGLPTDSCRLGLTRSALLKSGIHP